MEVCQARRSSSSQAQSSEESTAAESSDPPTVAIRSEAELCRPQAILVLAAHAAVHKGKVGVFPLLDQ